MSERIGAANPIGSIAGFPVYRIEIGEGAIEEDPIELEDFSRWRDRLLATARNAIINEEKR